MDAPRFIAELRRRNVLRAGVLYIGAVWALSQGAAQLLPVFDVSNAVTRWIVLAGIVGFPFWLAFAWFYEFTPQGFRREADVAPADSIAHQTGRRLDRWIIGVLAAAVVLLLTHSFVAQRAPDGAARVSEKSIAVLPLANEGGAKDEQYFSDGLSEELITALSQFDGLKVIGRNSAFMFRNSREESRSIGVKLGVAHLLEGSVRRDGDSVRINAELIRADDGSTVWSQRYERPYRDLFKLQDEIAEAVAAALKTKLLAGADMAVQSDRPPSGSLEAYTAYQQGKYHGGRSSDADYASAIEAYGSAIRIDPLYALAHAALADLLVTRAAQFLGGTRAQTAYLQARSEAQTAVSLQPNLAAAHLARGRVLFYADFDWTGAEAEFRRALQLAPNDSAAKFYLSGLVAALGKPEQALALGRQALVNDPLNAAGQLWIARYLCAVGKFDEARQTLVRAIDVLPMGAAYHEQLAIVWILKGDAAAALAAAEQEPARPWREMALALARQIGGDAESADAALQALIDGNADAAGYQIAQVYALRGDASRTFEWLDRSWKTRDAGIQNLLYDPLLLRYRDDPRFGEFCRKIGLPAPGGARQAGRAAMRQRGRAACERVCRGAETARRRRDV